MLTLLAEEKETGWKGLVWMIWHFQLVSSLYLFVKMLFFPSSFNCSFFSCLVDVQGPTAAVNVTGQKERSRQNTQCEFLPFSVFLFQILSFL